jgi:hypothetical protein
MIKFLWPDGAVAPLYIAIPLIVASWVVGAFIGYAIAGAIARRKGWLK